ncbi:FkbM family methyltransferase [Aquicoccus sp. SCR17]|nr:FkbM family methyltransferase [Carideicomes alvinocaridis]
MDAETSERFIRSRGLRIPRNPAILAPRIRKALRTDQYERKECDAMMRVVRRDDVVLELGAGIGYMSALIARKKPVREVHAYEANPLLIDYIRELHAANGVENVTLHNRLLAPEAGPPVAFHLRQNFLASSMDRDSDPDSITETRKIEVEPVNEALDRIRPTVLVADIEGAEAMLLPAARFTDLRAAIIELHPQWIGAEGVRAVFDAMHRAGLTYFPKASEAKVVAFRREW